MNPALLAILQLSAAGPAIAAETSSTPPKKDCDNSASTEIVVCGRTDHPKDQRIVPLPPWSANPINDDGRLNLNLGKAQITGGGPMVKNGQSVGLGVRIRL